MKETAVEIAKETGKYLLDNFRKDDTLKQERGLSKEVTTKYDKECDKLIIERIRKEFPEHGLITEESGDMSSKSPFVWIVDSLDGSGNFASGNPFFSVSIALMKENELILGVVYAPFLQELYVAEKGKGATLNGHRIEVSNIEGLEKAYVVACEGGSKSNARMADVFSKIYPNVKDMRKLGSAAIECGFVASGRADAYVTLSIYPWDVAAGVLLVREAGGQVSDFEGAPWESRQSDVICSNGMVHKDILKKIFV